MNKRFFRLLCTAFFLAFFMESYADLRDEWLSLSRIDRLCKYRGNSISRQISSYDRTGGNDDGFSGKYSYLRKEEGSLMIAELKGPGVIDRIWTPTPSEDTIQFYFDNEEEPRINIRFIDLYTGSHYPFVKPIVGNEVGGYYCYLPIPYKSFCKIVYKGQRMQFFQIQYRELVDCKSFTSFPKEFSMEEKSALDLAVEAWSHVGKDVVGLLPASGAETKCYTTEILLRPGKTIPFFQHNRGGRIIGFELVPMKQLNACFKDIILRAVWDDGPVAAIQCPVGDFFGYAFGKPSMQSMLAGVKEQVHYCYFPMPYDQSASLELVYLENPDNRMGEIPVKAKVYYSIEKRGDDEGKFYAEWKREINPETGKPFRILQKEGRGHYVGTVLQAQGLNPGMTVFFEGDDQCTIDGEVRIHGTGSEDYFNGGWYALPDRWDQAFSLPVHGCLGYSIPLARTGGYRFYIPDKLSFKKEILLTIEHGPETNNIPVDYTSVAFYYSDTPPVSNSIPRKEYLAAIQPPSVMEYWIDLLPVKAMSRGGTLSRDILKDSNSGRNLPVIKFEAGINSFLKVELEVPESGSYKLFLSYFKGPGCCLFSVRQRQSPVVRDMDAYAPENIHIDREYIGNLLVTEKTNTLTFVLGGNGKTNQSGRSFYLNKICLEKAK